MLTLEIVESCYEQADQWSPERWSTKPHMVKDKRAFAPFALGK
jgi:hypothetical protein